MGRYFDSENVVTQKNGLFDLANSSTTNLLAGAVYTGAWVDTLNYNCISIGVIADQDSAEAGFEIQWSSDGVNIDQANTYAIKANFGEQYTDSPRNRYYRLVYKNGLVDQTFFSLQSVLKKAGFVSSSVRIGNSITEDDDAQLVKAVLTGRAPNKTFVNVNTSAFGNLLVSLDEQKDAFGRLKTAEPFSIFDSSITTPNANDLFWDVLSNGGASSSYDRPTSKVTLSTAGTGDYAIRQTKQRFKYQPAKSHEFFLTGVWDTEVGQRKRGGLVDYDNIGLGTVTNNPQNGVFFENNAGALSWNICNNGVITESILQADWNLDKADGTGKAGFVLDVSAANILTGQLEWLGAGVVLVGFVTPGGVINYVHSFQHAGVAGNTDVYMRTANLPIAYEITSLSGSGSSKAICSSVISGGGFNPNGVTNAVQNTSEITVQNGTTELMLGIRLKTDSFEYTVEPRQISILSESNGNTLWHLAMNPTFGGTTPTWADVPNSEIQMAEAEGNNTVSDFGIVLGGGSFSNNTDSLTTVIETVLRIGKDLSGTRDEMWLMATATNQNEKYWGTINFKELI